MTAGFLDLGGKPLRSKWTHVLTTDLDVAIQSSVGTWDSTKTWTWEFASGLVITGSLSSDHLTLTFFEAAATIDLVPPGTSFGMFNTSPRLCWAAGTLTVDTVIPDVSA